ncbi:antitoxin of toxin-antitoxin stability system [uncultured Brevundimonas sp.]|uniref:antitoxin of toxin-antitoxin stability system n=1 Tax=uncultured Brevundimonas sp. TaxID=213418 RepID=UPI0025CD4471|nr:antitoxin of toxin-antitoxin stability system [uncultured Brevundimonas sp.]
MAKESVFTLKLEPELRDAFMAEAEAAHRPASQVVRELMREFVQKQQESRSYDAFVAAKVAQGLASVRRGEGISNEVVAADFAERRRRILAK